MCLLPTQLHTCAPPVQIVNLVSSDVRRLDDFGTFWVFLITSIVELAAVCALIAVVLGVAPAFAGVSSLLLMIPVQACCLCDREMGLNVCGYKRCQREITHAHTGSIDSVYQAFTGQYSPLHG